MGLYGSLGRKALNDGAHATSSDTQLIISLLWWIRGVSVEVRGAEASARILGDLIALLETAKDDVVLSEAYEIAVAIAPGLPDLLYKYASTLARAGRHVEALAVTRECLFDARASVLAAELLLHPLSSPREALHIAEQGLGRADPNVPRLQHLIAVAKARLARTSGAKEAERLRKEASAAFAEASKDPAMAGLTISYNAALLQAERARLHKARHQVVEALKVDKQSSDVFHLFALILSGQKDYEAALRACEAGGAPDAQLLLTQASIEILTVGSTKALGTLQQAVVAFAKSTEPGHKLTMMQMLASSQVSGTVPPTSRIQRSFSRRDATRDHPAALNMVASTVSVTADIEVPEHREAMETAVAVWTASAAFFIGLGSWDEAETCVSEAAQIRLADANVWTCAGRIEEGRGNYEQATKHFQNALQFDLSHTAALQGLGRVLLRLAAEAPQGSQTASEYTVQAEHYLRAAIEADEHDYMSWALLAHLYLATGQPIEASTAFEEAAKYEMKAPIRPFRTLQYRL